MALNVNYPPLEPRKVKGLQVLKQGRSHYFSVSYERSKDDPQTFLPVMAKRAPKDDSPDADTTAYNQGFITVVPLDGDYTADARERSLLRPLTLERLAP
jgi:3-phytase/alkaline phosphatase D/5'-nucleotidase